MIFWTSRERKGGSHVIVPWRDPYIYCICLSGVFQQLQSREGNSWKSRGLKGVPRVANKFESWPFSFGIGERFGFGPWSESINPRVSLIQWDVMGDFPGDPPVALNLSRHSMIQLPRIHRRGFPDSIGWEDSSCFRRSWESLPQNLI